MLYTIAVILLVAWLLGVVGLYTIGSFVHVLLVVAIVLLLVGLLGGRRVLGYQPRIETSARSSARHMAGVPNDTLARVPGGYPPR